MLCAGSLPLAAESAPPAAEFVPPAEGPVPFRRDKLPVDVDTMSTLSRQLTMFTGARVADDPDELRAVAQMIALALALDPENRAAKELIVALKGGKAPESVPEEDLERARARAWQVLAWLEMPEAGADGQALAACLGDVLVMADPHHPKARERRSAGEQGAWKEWVAEEAAFLSKETTPEMEPEEGTETESPEQGKKAAVLALKELAAPMPIWYYDKSDRQTKLAMVPVTLQASIADAAEDDDDDDDDNDDNKRKGRRGSAFEVEVPGDGMTERFAKAMHLVESAIIQRHGTLPSGLRVKLNFGKMDYSLISNGWSLTGTTALLLDGALGGKIPAAATLAVVGEDGKLELPPRFWQTLRAFSLQSSGSRLILPDQAADYLTALVILDDAAFFMKHEVLLAGTVDELCNLAAPAPKAEIADGLQRFDEVRKVGQGKPLGTFVAHPATQQRLRELAGVMPEHASARMLALQGSGSRPRFLQRPILAREIRTAMEPFGYFAAVQPKDLDPDQLDQAQEASRERLDRLAGYIDIRDRDLHKAAMDVVDSLRSLSRLLPKEDPKNSSNGMQKQTEAYNATRREYVALLRELTLAAGDAEDFPLPGPPKQD